ncbi:DUF5959 family protein [Streptomyces sp. NPDC012461]|uniref:DUF5959 family protein n=1 Tax=Streptomyces sp. NPDC012461 TaxID=3155117 RepID=UPI003408AB07
MNDEARCAELLTFEDSAQSVTVNVMWDSPTVMGEERHYTAEIVLQSAFVSGRVGLQVSLADLDEWGRCLDSLEADNGVQWPAGDRGACLEVVPDDPVEVTVCDSPSTQISVCVPIDVASDWLEKNRLKWDAARRAVASG